MKNYQKALSLMLIVVLVGVVLVGCGDNKEAPEDVTQVFYDDMVDVVRQIEKERDSDAVFEIGIEKTDEYTESENILSEKEKYILNEVRLLRLNIATYDKNSTDTKDRLLSEKHIEAVSALLEIDINTNKMLNKKIQNNTK